MIVRLLLCVALSGVAASAQLSRVFTAPAPVLDNSIVPNHLAADTNGNTWTFQTINPADASPDFRVNRYDPNGSLLFSRVFGGSQYDVAEAITAGPNGTVYVAGETNSPDFTFTQVFGSVPPASLCMFLLQLDPQGKVLFSDAFPDVTPRAMTTDLNGAVYITGTTYNLEPNFATKGAFQTSGATVDAFVMKVSGDGSTLIYATRLGGETPTCVVQQNCFGPNYAYGEGIEIESGLAIAVDGAGVAYIAGETDDADFPTTPTAFQKVCNCRATGTNAFLSELSADGSSLLYSTYYGAGSGVVAQAITLDPAKNVYVAGSFTSTYQDLSCFLFGVALGGTTPLFSQPLTQRASVIGLYWNGANTLMMDSLGFDFRAIVQQYSTVDGSAGPTIAVLPLGLAELGMLPFQTPSTTNATPAGFVVAGNANVITAFAFSDAEAPIAFALTDSAAVRAQTSIAPGELITLFGENLGPAAGYAVPPTGGFFPVAAAGTQVTFDGIPSPLLYVSAGQLNAVVPFEVSGRETTNVEITSASGVISYTYPVAAANPQIFADASGSIVFNQDGTRNSVDAPASAGSTITFFATGVGNLVDPPGTDGLIATSQIAQESTPELPVTVVFTLGATPQTVYTAKVAPAAGTVAGVERVTVQIPSGLPSAANTFNLVVGDAQSRTQNVDIQ